MIVIRIITEMSGLTMFATNTSETTSTIESGTEMKEIKHIRCMACNLSNILINELTSDVKRKKSELESQQTMTSMWRGAFMMVTFLFLTGKWR